MWTPTITIIDYSSKRIGCAFCGFPMILVLFCYPAMVDPQKKHPNRFLELLRYQRYMAVGHKYHFGIGAPPILGNFSGWIVGVRVGFLTHGQVASGSQAHRLRGAEGRAASLWGAVRGLLKEGDPFFFFFRPALKEAIPAVGVFRCV